MHRAHSGPARSIFERRVQIFVYPNRIKDGLSNTTYLHDTEKQTRSSGREEIDRPQESKGRGIKREKNRTAPSGGI